MTILYYYFILRLFYIKTTLAYNINPLNFPFIRIITLFNTHHMPLLIKLYILLMSYPLDLK